MSSKIIIVWSILLYFSTRYPTLIEGQHAPCLFIIGDSFSDNGNNNYLITLAKSNYLPYGIDYPDGPTGRFTNGKVFPDFIAEYLGFEKPIPPFVTANGIDILKGVNYASAGGGILDETGKFQGSRFSMRQQLVNHKSVISKIALVMGNQSRAEEHVRKCLYVVNMGSNEYLNNYLLPLLYQSSLIYTPQQFATIVIKTYSQHLRSLYNYGARKIVVYELVPIGCIPQKRLKYGKIGSICDESLNKLVQPFNDELKLLIDELNADLVAAKFILINTASIFQSNHSELGIKIMNTPCCTVMAPVGLCKTGKEICSNRSEYFFWDNYHPSENGHRAVAARSYDAQSPTNAYPFDIRHLVQKQ